MILNDWAHRGEVKCFPANSRGRGIGTDFGKLKYPFVSYDLLHVLDVLSRFPQARLDVRSQEMVGELVAQADKQGRFTATSMYRAWQRWSFADKRRPSRTRRSSSSAGTPDLIGATPWPRNAQ